MTTTTAKLATAAEAYFSGLRRVFASGAATDERSTYLPLANLLDAVGATLKPKVRCLSELADHGAGHPDFGLFTANQMRRGASHQGQKPERGVVEVKGIDHDASLTADGEQVTRYWNHYQLVLVTNYRDFVLVGRDRAGNRTKLETLRLADSADDFRRKLEKPRSFAQKVGPSLGEYLARALLARAPIVEPKNLAWLLASHARDALARVETAGDEDPFPLVRSALQETLGVRFDGQKGAHFFHSTLVQTLFYGVFSAWVLWARQLQDSRESFRWQEAGTYLRTPLLSELFHQFSYQPRLEGLDILEVLDWAAAALDRVDRAAFFARFNEGEAVQYFYEPFLKAFDPALRKQLSVWYTPPEVVRYMVARVDRALKDELGISDGLAANNVHVLDPCCGTGAYLTEVLRRIAANLEERGEGSLAGMELRKAAARRLFGFEIMPAPFVVSHLQVGLAMEDLGAAFERGERANVYLSNALTGWEPTTDEKQRAVFPEMAAERSRANTVKQEQRILVILGNPPYNGFAGMAVDEERDLSTAYRETKRVRRPEGQGLNDPYVRFFRMAERRIVENTGEGIVCFISNYSWLDGLSFTGMRERYLDAFDAIRIDCLNGDKYKTGKVAPDGSPDPSIFSTKGDSVGIQVGTAITTLVRKASHAPAEAVDFRHLWGRAKLAELVATAEAQPATLYDRIEPVLPLGLPFTQAAVSDEWFSWPTLADLFRISFPGVKTSRDEFLVDTDRDRLELRVAHYFDHATSHEELARRYPSVMKTTGRFDARAVRETLLKRGGPKKEGLIAFSYRPFDNRWLYWEADTKLLDEKRSDYKPHVFEGNVWLVFQNKARPHLSPPLVISNLGDLNQMNSGVYCLPMWLVTDDALTTAAKERTVVPNLTCHALTYIERLGLSVEDLFHHVIAILHSSDYNALNADALRAEGPRIPLPPPAASRRSSS